MTAVAVVFCLIVGGLLVASIRGFFRETATPWDQVGRRTFGDFSDEGQRGAPLDWEDFPELAELLALSPRRPGSLPPVHIERRRAA